MERLEEEREDFNVNLASSFLVICSATLQDSPSFNRFMVLALNSMAGFIGRKMFKMVWFTLSFILVVTSITFLLILSEVILFVINYSILEIISNSTDLQLYLNSFIYF